MLVCLHAGPADLIFVVHHCVRAWLERGERSRAAGCLASLCVSRLNAYNVRERRKWIWSRSKHREQA